MANLEPQVYDPLHNYHSLSNLLSFCQSPIFVYLGLNYFIWSEASEHVKGNKIELNQMAANFKPYIEKDLKASMLCPYPPPCINANHFSGHQTS